MNKPTIKGLRDLCKSSAALEASEITRGFQSAWVDSKIPNYIDLQRYIHPCKIAADSFNIDSDHPSEYKHQVQAHGVSICADICPRFNPADYKLSGKPVKVDAFNVE